MNYTHILTDIHNKSSHFPDLIKLKGKRCAIIRCNKIHSIHKEYIDNYKVGTIIIENDSMDARFIFGFIAIPIKFSNLKLI